MKPTENIAVIDVGSNTLRLLIGNLKENRIYKLYTDRVVTRLGKDLIKNSVITEETLKISIETLKNFKKLSEKFDVSCIIAFGTSALREAKNAEDFCEVVKKKTGIDIHIISGQEEAYYTLCGVMDEELKKEDSVFIVDIGGGSTEWIYYNGNNFNMGSIPVGALKIKEIFLNSEPYDNDHILKAKAFINEELKKFFPEIKTKKLIATGGTASTLAMIFLELSDYSPEKTHMISIYTSIVKEILKKLLSIPLQRREKIKGMPPDRADIICQGLLILDTIADYLNADKITISEYGILEGVMKNYKKFCYNSSL